MKGKIEMLYRQIKYTRRDIGSLFGAYNDFFKSARGARIVLYHGICQDDPTRFNYIFLRKKTFEGHLRFYKENFNVISLDDFYNKRFSNDRFNICITFDDGYANNYKYVLPLLQQYEMPAAFFITAIRGAGYDILWNDFLAILSRYGPEKLTYRDERFIKKRGRYVSIDNRASLSETLRSGNFNIKAGMMKSLYPAVPFKENKSEQDYWLQMDEQQIAVLANSKWATIGCHSYYHNDLARISIDDAEQEMSRSKKYLEQVTGKEIKAFAFPYGTYTRNIVSAAKRAGFTQLLAMDFHFAEDQSDAAMRERFTVNPFVSVNNQMYAIIKGNYSC